ncbi:MAG: hypothetical protein A3F83_04615 [Candidatus Glassbacteria bacterium RIFCSPLOWO2_12_FULL_58_11]|uniref:Radical SAM core domain-containing protein n=1 Tax=Candidatus Glassbacteria bacterium RIFCSPLOWO2_12_FULL_58_11 TaxID=1817867 RepID=A0A1F5YWF5_9BACT|nr:MAG: hypothetical protein A3F83_04615 [Candidatus Glassbacteria bacterium RIFCSPLOWO2_12_FULL_58_11]
MSGYSNMEKLRGAILAQETGTLLKSGYCPCEVGLAALSPYPVAMSSLGFQTVYRIFNSLPEVRCERLFLLGRGGLDKAGEWLSLESGRKAGEFKVLAASISYEQETLMLPRALAAAGIPLYAAERGEGAPVVICGGPVITANPEPLAPFIDVCAIGDSERLAPDFAALWLEAFSRGWPRQHLLEALAAREGFYIPALYETRPEKGPYPVAPFPASGRAPATVRRAVNSRLDPPAHSAIVSDTTHFKRMFMVEVARGCRWNCRFCLVCRVNRPYRPVPAERVIEALSRAPRQARSAGLVGANLCDHPELEAILEAAAARGLRLGISSLRVDTVSRSLLELLKKCGVGGLTLAPETASAELLSRIGKRYSRERLFEVVELMSREGFESLKLYYMIGLPGESRADREELARQIRELAACAGTGMKLKVSLNPFVPKPQTAWQDESMFRPGEIKAAIRQLRRDLSGPGARVELQAGSPAEAVAQAVISLGDRTLAAPLARAAVEPGERFLDCLDEAGVELDPLLYKRKKPAELHPWRVLECEPSIS